MRISRARPSSAAGSDKTKHVPRNSPPRSAAGASGGGSSSNRGTAAAAPLRAPSAAAAITITVSSTPLAPESFPKPTMVACERVAVSRRRQQLADSSNTAAADEAEEMYLWALEATGGAGSVASGVSDGGSSTAGGGGGGFRGLVIRAGNIAGLPKLSAWRPKPSAAPASGGGMLIEDILPCGLLFVPAHGYFTLAASAAAATAAAAPVPRAKRVQNAAIWTAWLRVSDQVAAAVSRNTGGAAAAASATTDPTTPPSTSSSFLVVFDAVDRHVQHCIDLSKGGDPTTAAAASSGSSGGGVGRKGATTPATGAGATTTATAAPLLTFSALQHLPPQQTLLCFSVYTQRVHAVHRGAHNDRGTYLSSIAPHPPFQTLERIALPFPLNGAMQSEAVALALDPTQQFIFIVTSRMHVVILQFADGHVVGGDAANLATTTVVRTFRPRDFAAVASSPAAALSIAVEWFCAEHSGQVLMPEYFYDAPLHRQQQQQQRRLPAPALVANATARESSSTSPVRRPSGPTDPSPVATSSGSSTTAGMQLTVQTISPARRVTTAAAAQRPAANTKKMQTTAAQQQQRQRPGDVVSNASRSRRPASPQQTAAAAAKALGAVVSPNRQRQAGGSPHHTAFHQQQQPLQATAMAAAPVAARIVAALSFDDVSTARASSAAASVATQVHPSSSTAFAQPVAAPFSQQQQQQQQHTVPRESSPATVPSWYVVHRSLSRPADSAAAPAPAQRVPAPAGSSSAVPARARSQPSSTSSTSSSPSDPQQSMVIVPHTYSSTISLQKASFSALTATAPPPPPTSGTGWMAGRSLFHQGSFVVKAVEALARGHRVAQLRRVFRQWRDVHGAMRPFCIDVTLPPHPSAASGNAGQSAEGPHVLVLPLGVIFAASTGTNERRAGRDGADDREEGEVDEDVASLAPLAVLLDACAAANVTVWVVVPAPDHPGLFSDADGGDAALILDAQRRDAAERLRLKRLQLLKAVNSRSAGRVISAIVSLPSSSSSSTGGVPSIIGRRKVVCRHVAAGRLLVVAATQDQLFAYRWQGLLGDPSGLAAAVGAGVPSYGASPGATPSCPSAVYADIAATLFCPTAAAGYAAVSPACALAAMHEVVAQAAAAQLQQQQQQQQQSAATSTASTSRSRRVQQQQQSRLPGSAGSLEASSWMLWAPHRLLSRIAVRYTECDASGCLRDVPGVPMPVQW